eukprot:gnl/MRDRNA2_/MRDRNA2_111278_c0_seq1.p1 gnl/MRDRNA2_/MRDRNA2_111278_c0~~gnl/MRDRNA2_/MRDRNA2_111278_c0_seq1.p1  ORF type:complete len:643 (-),score=155.14 gnl/MRDRNA2_/MRDRNA2_111278_c0_seq1:755-2527(-)
MSANKQSEVKADVKSEPTSFHLREFLKLKLDSAPQKISLSFRRDKLNDATENTIFQKLLDGFAERTIEIDFYTNKTFSGHGLKILEKAKLPNLTGLKLGRTGMKNDVAGALTRVLENCPKLKRLWVHKTDFSDKSLVRIATSIQANCSKLTTFDFYECAHLTENGTKEIVRILENHAAYDSCKARASDAANINGFEAAAQALGEIEDLKIQGQVTKLQVEMSHAFFSGDFATAGEKFEALQAKAEPETERLGKLIGKVMAKYKELKVRYQYIENIPKDETNSGLKQLLPNIKMEDTDEKSKDKKNHAFVRAMLWKASEVEPAFRTKMAALVHEFNSATTASDICAAHDIDEEEFQLELRTKRVQLCQDSNAVVFAKFGPSKSFDRALAKGYEWLWDLNRLTMEFEDPYVMALMLAVLRKNFSVVRVVNKFKPEESSNGQFVQPPDLHINIDFEGGWLVEVQLLLSDFLTIKKTLHKFYEITRAKQPEEVLQRVFQENLTPDVMGDLSFSAESVQDQTQPAAATQGNSDRQGGMVSLSELEAVLKAQEDRYEAALKYQEDRIVARLQPERRASGSGVEAAKAIKKETEKPT